MFGEFEYCRHCGEQEPADKLSQRGLCARCGLYRVRTAAHQLQDRNGPIYGKWKRKYIASLSGVIERLRGEQ